MIQDIISCSCNLCLIYWYIYGHGTSTDQYNDTKVAYVVDVSTYSIQDHCGENETDACKWKNQISLHVVFNCEVQ